MTRDDFYNDIACVEELIDFCNEWGYESYVEDIVYCSDMDDEIREEIIDYARDHSWDRLRDVMNNLPEEGYDYYTRGGYLDYSTFDDYDFEQRRDSVAEAADYDNFFDSPEDEEDSAEADAEAEEEKEREEMMPIEFLLTGVCAAS